MVSATHTLIHISVAPRNAGGAIITSAITAQAGRTSAALKSSLLHVLLATRRVA